MASNTVRRDWLKRQIIKGNMLAKCDGKYTDDYVFDAATNFGITAWLPASYFPTFWTWLEENNLEEKHRNADEWGQKDILKEYSEQKEKVKNNGILFDNNDFRGHGSAWRNPDGTICLSFGHVSYTLKIK